MREIMIVAKKEFLDTFRDKRTLMRMIIIPLLAFPLIFKGVSYFQEQQSKKEADKTLKIGYIGSQKNQVIDRISKKEKYEAVSYEDTNKIKEAILNKTINLGLYFEHDPYQSNDFNKAMAYKLFMASERMEEYDRFENYLKTEDSLMVANKMHSIGKDYSYSVPSIMEKRDLSDLKVALAKYAGGMLPYIFIAFLFMGCMIPGIDLFAGEKERGTIETLLTVPISRINILIGKLIVISSMGLLTAIIALTGLMLSLKFFDLGGGTMTVINEMLSVKLMITLLVLLFPLAVFFAGVMIPISVYSKSFKEAQSILTPLNVVMVLPAIIGFIPGIELNYVTAFIPIVNVVLATKQIIADQFDAVLIGITFVSLVLLAVISVIVSVKQFEKETNILR